MHLPQPSADAKATPPCLSPPLPFPLESYVCRAYLRTGKCLYGAAAHLQRQQQHDTAQSANDSNGTAGGNQMRQPSLTTFGTDPPPPQGSSESASTSTSDDDTPVASPSGKHNEVRRQRRSPYDRECHFIHLLPTEIVPVLKRLVFEGRGFVVCCKDFQCRPGGCTRGDKTHTMCRYLHLSSQDEAAWLERTTPAARELRAAFLLAPQNGPLVRQLPRRPAIDARHVGDASQPARGVASMMSPHVVTATLPLCPAFPRIVVGGNMTEVCRQHLRGQCFRGVECRFRHTASETTATSVGPSSSQQHPPLGHRSGPPAAGNPAVGLEGTSRDLSTTTDITTDAALSALLQQLLSNE